MFLDRRRMMLASAAAALAATAARGAEPETLRVVWLQGNPVQARLVGEKAQGPAIDLAEAIAKKLGRRLEVAGVAGVEPLLERVRSGEADLGFIAYDPSRGGGLVFTPPYLISLNRYAVRASSPVVSAEQVDRDKVRVGAILADAGGLYLQRTLKHGTLFPQASAEAAIAALRQGSVDVIAANGQRLADVQAVEGYRILPGSFFGVPQTAAIRQDRPELLKAANEAVSEMIGLGGMTDSIRRWGLAGAEAAPKPD